ncbi:hypothetical protein Tamer19_09570 [Cupriavidus sp. TA19]|uniref:hypothetical protein n=1 Tax=Cupriavidus sp. TA19 TaxID=701108 RepID=UPI0027294650|nr:hypothetical protein [Cupriavidus sp. TA19]GLC91549.1 hypothetical protein Tamer19_09570 [Cupriavidus sp. TA19]
MRQSSLAVDAVPRRTAARGSEGTVPSLRVVPQPATAWIRLRLAVASTEVFGLRQTLHSALGAMARVYVVKVDYRQAPLVSLMFAEPNPAPVKAALALSGVISPETPLPLQPASSALVQRLEEAIALLPQPSVARDEHLAA